MRRHRLAAAALFVLVPIALLFSPAPAKEPSDPTLLWSVIRNLCLPNYTRTGLAFPCTEVDPRKGIAIVKYVEETKEPRMEYHVGKSQNNDETIDVKLGSDGFLTEFLGELGMTVEEAKQPAGRAAPLDEAAFVLVERRLSDLEKTARLALGQAQLLPDPPDRGGGGETFHLFLGNSYKGWS